MMSQAYLAFLRNAGLPIPQEGGGGGGGSYDPYANYPIQWGQHGDHIPGEGTPSGILYDQLNNANRPGYYHTGGGSGYIHGTPEDEQRAWNLFLEMKRNGWDPYAPGSIEEARRGMGEFTEEQFDRYFEDFLRNQQPGISTNDFEQGGGEFGEPGGNFELTDNGPIDLGWMNNLLVKGLGKGKLGKLGIGKWLKHAQEGATLDDWLNSLKPNQLDYIDEWMIGLGADKNWEDRLRQGEAPWSRTGEAIDKTQRQNPNGPDLVNDEDDPRIGGGKRNPPDKPGGGDGGEPEGSYDGPFGLPAYAGMAFSPSFLAYQPYNTNGPVQFVPGRK